MYILCNFIGTATKRDIQPEDNVVFKDKKYCQIIELKNQETVKVVHQPSAYKKEELIKLTYKDNHVVKLITESHGIEEPKSNETESPKLSDTDSNDCPKLVPIIDEDGFQLYNPNASDEDDSEADEELDENCSYEYADDSSMDDVSLGSEYTEINSDDADSLMSEDINEKYMNRGQREYYSSDDEDIRKAAASLRTADVIDATKCAFSGPKRTKRKNNAMDPDDANLLPSQKLSKLIKVGSKSTVLTTDILEKQLPEESTEKLTLNSDEEIKSSTDEIDNKSKPSLEENENKLESSKENKVESDSNKDDETNKNLHVPDYQSNIASHKQHNQQTPKKSTNQSLADYKTIFCNAINTNLVLVLLKDAFYIYGTVRLTLLAGKVNVYGHSLELNKEVEIFSPRGCSVIEISPLLLENEKTPGEQLQQLLKKYETDFLLADLENLTKSYEPGKDAVILLKRNEERKKVVHQFKKFMNENVFPNLQNINMDRPLYNSEYILRCMINTSATEQKCLRLPNQWLQLHITEKSRVLLAGGKGVGKSTLLRYLINKQLPKTQKVLLIDLDIGQPEIFVPQTISCSLVTKPLLGPGFFLNIQPEKSYAVGHTNIALCSHRYVAAVRQLIDYCMSQQEFTNIPWFVNTMGYNKGFGLELISLICKALPLTDTIQLQSNKDINNFESLLFPHVVEKIPRLMFLENNSGAHDTIKLTYRTHIWQSAISQESRYQKEWDMSPKDMRYAMLLTRLSMALAIKGHADFLTDCKPLR